MLLKSMNVCWKLRSICVFGFETGMSDPNAMKEPPFGAEYAKSGRSSCKTCKQTIPQGELRMSTRFPSPYFDGIQDSWHHYNCFWKRPHANINEASINRFDVLKWVDQERIRAHIRMVNEHPDDYETAKAEIVKSEYAKSGAGKCHECKEKIAKGELRLQYKVSFYHPKCLFDLNIWKQSASDMEDFDILTGADKEWLESMFSVSSSQGTNGIKRKSDANDNENCPAAKHERLEDTKERRRALKKQSEVLWDVMDDLRDKLTKDEIENLVVTNGSRIYKKQGIDSALELLADLIVFGALKPCGTCHNNLRYNDSERMYKCCGNFSQYTSCPFSTRTPEREKFRVSKRLMKDYEFLVKYHNKTILEKRVFSVLVEENQGGAVKINENVQKRYRKGSEVEEERRCINKNGCFVDPKCTVAEETHVYIENNKPWQALLAYANIENGRNGYYKLQLLKHDNKEWLVVLIYYVFRSWGRTGTISGGSKTECFDEDLDDAKENFEELFRQKSSGNEWSNVENFRKRSSGMNLIEMDFDKSQSDLKQKLDPKESTSELPLSVRECIGLFFDIEKLRMQMREFDLDTDKMPLGRLSRRVIIEAHGILSSLEKILQEDVIDEMQILDKSNHFYSLIPHSIGLAQLPLIDSLEAVKSKTEMLDSLLEIEIAYKEVEKVESEVQNGPQIDPFDRYYEQLKCKIELLSEDSTEAQLVKKYAHNTHGDTHNIRVQVKEVFKIERHGEEEKFTTEIPNRKLLWHGSRLSNFAGILSQGLRIAPPEAPLNGYMFGKGVYFADIVSKSANYCMAKQNTDSFLLLCEVALGKIQEQYDANPDIKKPKKGYHSVKGLGATVPNDEEFEVLSNGLIVPCGRPIKANQNKQLSLLYNEYIVYNVDQIKIKYLVRTNIDHQ
ncbi:Poly [ADP-ribose] polymerase [Aphelenchoides besseyi]|nr:Poly [ADP-ribose] polymerase [Aphelenchoides besseyi]KAI6195144.1 Poly [ADP-ribose] polymerase [Aphelenchoides besseyi]